MNTELGNNEELTRRLEEQIRECGEPYAAPAPDPLYWANFRVRVNERIAQEHRNWVRRWLMALVETPVRIAITGTTAAAVIAGILLMIPSAPQRVSVPPIVKAPMAARQTAEQKVPDQAIKKEATAPSAKQDYAAAVKQAGKRSEEYASRAVKRGHQEAFGDNHGSENDIAALLTADESVSRPVLSDGSVSINDLTASELENVLKDLQK